MLDGCTLIPPICLFRSNKSPKNISFTGPSEALVTNVLHQPQHHGGILCLTHNDTFPILLLTKREFLSNKQAFLDSVLIQEAVIRNLQVMVESNQRISSQNKDVVPDINWRAISGFRNILVHDYLEIDIGTVWGVIKNRLPELKKQLKTLLEN